VAAAAEAARDRRDVDAVRVRPQRPLPGRRRARGELADERDELGAVDGAEVVDDPLGVRLLGAGRLEVRAAKLRDDDPAACELACVLERPREELQLRERRRLVDLDEDLAHVRARFDELRGEAKRLRRRVRVLEPSRVSHDRRVERLGDLRRQGDGQLREEVGQHLGGRRGVRDDEIHVAEARVVVVVVDVDRQAGLLGEPRLDDPVLLRAVDRDEDARRRVRWRLAQQPVLLEPQEAVLTR
jgi:hypothetical protein